MCFSASASFGAGVILTAIGVASVKQVKKSTQIFFAAIPLLFAVQQASEGVVWLSLSSPGYASLQHVATYIFLFFAQVVWPVWVPFAILKFEPTGIQKTPGKLLLGIGALVSVYLAYCLFTFPVEARIYGAHISYDQHYPASIGRYCGFLYIVATIVPPFFSRIRGMWILGTAILISYIITQIFYSDYIVSVWCFFASIISITVLVILHLYRKSQIL